MKRGETLNAKIVSCQTDGLKVFIQERNEEVLLPSNEIVGGLKKKHQKMIGEIIVVRVKSLRPFAISAKRVNANKSNKEKEESKPKFAVSVRGFPHGFMVWWTKEKNAARYFVYLYIGNWSKKLNKYVVGANQNVAVVELDRSTSYHSFTNLAHFNIDDREYYRSDGTPCYFVKVEAEDRDGKVIVSSGMYEVYVDKIPAPRGYY